MASCFLWVMFLVSLGSSSVGLKVLDTSGEPIRFGDKFFIRTHDSSWKGVMTEIYKHLDYIHLAMEDVNCIATYFAKKNPQSKAATVKTNIPIYISMTNSSFPNLNWWTCSMDGVYLGGNLSRTEMAIVPSENDPPFVYTIVTLGSTMCSEGRGGRGSCNPGQAKSLMFSKGTKHWAYCSPDFLPTKIVFVRK